MDDTDQLQSPEPEPAPAPAPAATAAPASGATKAVVLERDGPFLVLPPHLPKAVKFWPLYPVTLPAALADALIAEGAADTVGAKFRLATADDRPSDDHLRRIKAEQAPRRCCG